MKPGTTFVAWEGKGNDRHLEQAHFPDISTELEGPEPPKNPPRTDFVEASEALREVFNEVLVVGRNGEIDYQASFRSFCGMVWTLRPEVLQNKPLAQIAPHLNCHRATLSKITRAFGDKFGIRNGLMKREGAREAYSRVQLRDHWRRRPKKKPGTPGEMPGADGESTNPKPEVVT